MSSPAELDSCLQGFNTGHVSSFQDFGDRDCFLPLEVKEITQTSDVHAF